MIHDHEFVDLSPDWWSLKPFIIHHPCIGSFKFLSRLNEAQVAHTVGVLHRMYHHLATVDAPRSDLHKAQVSGKELMRHAQESPSVSEMRKKPASESKCHEKTFVYSGAMADDQDSRK